VWVSSKQGFVYVFDRTNGTPVWPIEERPVPTLAGFGARAHWPDESDFIAVMW
jgi:glucose dehydrogenase